MHAVSLWLLLMHVHVQGAVVRVVRRVEELLRQLVEGARVIGDADMAAKFSGCGDRIKRDIVFAASLYL